MMNNSREFRIRTADLSDLDALEEYMKEAADSILDPEWFVISDRAYIAECIRTSGIVIVAETGDGDIAGFFIVKIPQDTDDLGRLIGLTEEESRRVVYMDTAVVRPQYRGNHLQRKMEVFAEQCIRTRFSSLDGEDLYLLCTVHPQNGYSLQNMRTSGFEVMLRTICYGDKDRYILKKNIRI